MKLPPVPGPAADLRLAGGIRPAGLSRVLARIGAIKTRFRGPVDGFSGQVGFARALAQTPRWQPSAVRDAIKSAAARHQIEPTLLLALAEVESGLRPDALSEDGAAGILQLMPATARQLGVTDPFDIRAGIDAGARYLKEHLDRFQGDVPLALAAYNAGPGAVLRYGGVPPYAETSRFVARVLERQRTLASTGSRASTR